MRRRYTCGSTMYQPGHRVLTVIVTVLLLGACSGSPPSTVPIDENAAYQLMLTGVNQTGIKAPTEAWVEVAQRGCREGAWDHSVAFRIGQEAEDIVGRPLPAYVVWMLTVQACHDRVPPEALETGPPSIKGPPPPPPTG